MLEAKILKTVLHKIFFGKLNGKACSYGDILVLLPHSLNNYFKLITRVPSRLIYKHSISGCIFYITSREWKIYFKLNHCYPVSFS